MVRRTSPRFIALIIFAAFFATIQSLSAPAQKSDDLEALQRQVEQLDQAGKYAGALALQRRLAAETEKAESASTGKPGAKTVDALVSLAWYALLAHDFKEALAVSNRAHMIAPTDLSVETNRAHALLFMGRAREARAIYLAYKNKPMSMTDMDMWQDVVARDVADLKKAGLDYPAVAKIARELGGKATPSGQDLRDLSQKIQELENAGRLGDALALAQKFVALARQRYGEDHTEYATAMSWLGVLYYSQRDYAEAEPLYKHALAIDEKALGPDHPDVGRNLNNLGQLYRDQGRYAEAEPLYKRALAIDEKALGPDHPNVGTDLNNLAGSYSDQGRYAEAEPLYKRALAIDEKVHGPDHPNVGTDLDNLAGSYSDQGRYAEAEPLYKRALAIDEKAFGPDHPTVGAGLDSLGALYYAQGRYAEAEPLYERALAIDKKAFGPDHPTVGTDVNNLCALYRAEGRYAEAEPLCKRALAIRDKALGRDHNLVGESLNNLAALYQAQGRYAEAEPLYKRALAIDEKALGPDHPDVATRLNNLAALYDDQGRYAEAEPMYKRSLAIREKALGPDHNLVDLSLNNLAGLYFAQSDWTRAAEYWRRGTGVLIRRTQRGTLIGEALTGKRQSEAAQQSRQFWLLVKATDRLASKQGDQTDLPREMFQIAQWAQSSEAAESLAQMAARGAKGDPKLAALVRERQDLVEEWQRRDQVRSAAVAQAPEKRNKDAEAENITRLAAIDDRIASIDKELAANFPDYAALVNPAPLSVEEVQAQLRPDEAMILFLDTPEVKSAPEETFIWVVTNTDVRWVRTELGTETLTREVSALRCGLDYQGSWTDSHCSDVLKLSYTHADHDAFGKPLPFDLVRAHKLYQGLFGQVEDLIKDKHLLIVPSGPLTQLPFHVLVKSLPSDASTVERSREVARLGAELGNPSEDDQKRLHSRDVRGVRVVRVLKDSAAEAAGLKPGDIVLSFDGMEFDSYPKLIEAIQAHAPGDKVQIRVWRGGAELPLATTLGTMTIRVWIPRFLSTGEGKNIAWLARDHAATVLPAVSSLKALRGLAKESLASEAFIGFGDPLLDGEPAKFSEDAIAAKLAREAHCPASAPAQVAALTDRGATRAGVRSNGGLADVADLRSWAPLPETADELCDVAQNLNVDPATHLYIQSRATETTIKWLSDAGALAKYRIVHFATHGAVAGELSGTTEPGLILTPPDKASETDDGYLSASEIAGLKLDADWVILSACNTAAGEAKGAEALSGLARAFFYAGARSLLVSHWAVSSESTVKLITKAVAELKADPLIGRAEALRRSMLSMIDTGKNYEAHPAFWAPFVLVGEGGATR
jgi:tetratricopeptide (TPR) repeat protein/CHAT domain-containing protein